LRTAQLSVYERLFPKPRSAPDWSHRSHIGGRCITRLASEAYRDGGTPPRAAAGKRQCPSSSYLCAKQLRVRPIAALQPILTGAGSLF